LKNPENNNRASKIFRNFGFLAGGKTLGDLFIFFLFVTLTRLYGQEGIGEYSFAMAYAGFFVIASDFGLYFLSIKEMSRKTDGLSSYFTSILTARLFLSIASVLILWSSMYLLPFSYQSKLVIICIGVYQIIYTVTEGLSTIFISQQRMHVSAAIELTFRICLAVVGSSIAISGGSILHAVAFFPVIALVHFVFVYRYTNREFGAIKIKFSFQSLKSLLMEAMPYAAFMLLQQAATRVDVLLLGFLLGTAAAGVYNVSYRIIFMLMFMCYFASNAIFPVVSNLYKNNRDELTKFYHCTLNLVVLIIAPLVIGLWIISPKVIFILYGDQFEDSVIILQILSVLIGFSFFGHMGGTMLTACEMQSVRTNNQWVSACANILGNFILIPVFGIVGAAISSVFAELLLALLSIVKLKKLFGIPDLRYRFFIGLIGSAPMILIAGFVPEMNLALFILLAVLTYAIIILAFKTIRDNEVPLLLSAINRQVQ